MKKKNELMVINEQPITANDIFAAMDGVIANLYQTNDIAKAAYVLMALSKLDEVVGHSKAKLIYGMRSWWNETGQTDKRNMEFSDYIEGEGILGKTSIDRYLVVQEHIEDLSIPKQFHERPIRDLIPIAKALEQGYDISKAQWDDLKLAKDQAEVGRIIQEKVKKKQAKKNTKRIVLERDGSLVGWMNDVSYYLGYLDKKQYKEDPIAHQFIEMILDKFKVRVK